MTYYRLYFLGGGNGSISDFREFEVADDRAAIAIAERHHSMGAMELWSGGRKVRCWEPVGATYTRHLDAGPYAAGSNRLASP